MKKKSYEKPTMEVVKMQHTTLLQAGSPGGLGNPNGYPYDPSDPFNS